MKKTIYYLREDLDKVMEYPRPLILEQVLRDPVEWLLGRREVSYVVEEHDFHYADGYIWTNENFPNIVGRVSGDEGLASYQIAARPHDESWQPGFRNVPDAAVSLVRELERRVMS